MDDLGGIAEPVRLAGRQRLPRLGLSIAVPPPRAGRDATRSEPARPARVGGGTGDTARSGYSTAFLVLHVGLVSFAFAGFTLAAGLSVLYLWQERRLKSHRPAALLGRAPSLVTLETLTSRTIAVALPALTAGIVAGLVRLRNQGSSVDALMAVTLGTWAVYGSYLILRYEAGWHGRRAAYLALVGFAFVVVARLGLQVEHFS